MYVGKINLNQTIHWVQKRSARLSLYAVKWEYFKKGMAFTISPITPLPYYGLDTINGTLQMRCYMKNFLWVVDIPKVKIHTVLPNEYYTLIKETLCK